MSLPEIDFDKIRSHDNSRNAGFEELCCQLAGLEPREPTATFIRKGRGGDAGVECFVRHPSGQETGWQTKYVADWAAASPQLDKSIRTALNKHPNLDTYIVALPFDLSDARVDGRTSALESWENWKAKWLKVAADEGRPLSIELWAKSSISERLARDAPAYAGRLFYWFDQDALRPNWFRAKLERVKKALGSRYIPETNVELPIRRDFLALARDPSLNDEADDWQAKIQTSAFSVAGAIGEKKVGTPAELVTELDEALNELDQSSSFRSRPGWLRSIDRSVHPTKSCIGCTRLRGHTPSREALTHWIGLGTRLAVLMRCSTRFSANSNRSDGRPRISMRSFCTARRESESRTYSPMWSSIR